MTTEKHLHLGLDVGGTHIKAVAMNAQFTVCANTDVRSEAAKGPQFVRNAIRQTVSQLVESTSQIVSIGLGCAGSVDFESGIVRNSPNFADWKNIPLREWLETDFKVPSVIENDAKCAVLSEWKIGNAKGYKNVILLTLGTGIGGGLILNNQLYTGSTGTAGELGHFTLQANGKPCPCGNRGCFERYCSATTVQEQAPPFRAREIFAQPNDPRFKKIIEDFISNFQAGLVGISNVFDPDCILIGGGISPGLQPFFKEIESFVRLHAFPAVAEIFKILPTKFGNLSGAMGAALKGFDLI